MHFTRGACLLLAATLLASFANPVAPVLAADAEWTPLLDLRVRQEILDGVFHFAPDPNRNWIRVRTRAGARLDLTEHRFELLLTNAHRHVLTPDQDFDWHELIIDRAYWSWQIREKHRLTLGRQNIIWPGGFLMLEGHPLDGSRSIYQNALRLQSSYAWGNLDAALIHNPKYDPLVLAGDDELPLSDADETAGFLRASRGEWSGSLIYEFQRDPDGRLDDLTTFTMGARGGGGLGATRSWQAELALQYQDGDLRVAANEQLAEGTGWAFAWNALVSQSIGRRWELELDAFWYSGLDGSLRPFRTPWGRWPKWSELYIYTLIGESTPGRVHVAAWENIAAPRLNLSRGPSAST